MDTKSTDVKALQEELEQFRKEKEKIKELIGAIGGGTSKTQDFVLNIVFVVTVAVLFLFDALVYFFHVNISLPPLFLVDLGLLLISLKIIWIMHKQMKVEHFQFWILNSIEFRINELFKKMTTIEKKLDEKN